MSESKLQSEFVIWYKNTYPQERKRLFAVFNEGKNVTMKLGVGLTPGVCDLLYVRHGCVLNGFELKIAGSYHSVKHIIDQCRWMLDVLPGNAWFCDNLEAFQMAIGGDASRCVSPEKVLDYCISCRKKSIKWDEVSGFLVGK